MTSPMRSDAATPLADGDDAVIGRVVLDRFRVVRKLAVGGMGMIYLARTEGAAGFVRPVVVKRILPHLVGDQDMVKMFTREAKILSKLRHPGIVGIHEFAKEDDAYVMVLEYVHGFNLSRWVPYFRKSRSSFPAAIASHILVQVLDALHYAHTLRDTDGTPLAIVHRDVTPSNILLDTDGHVKLADFGIARMRSDATEVTQQGLIKGKFAYLAPELFKLEGDASAASDVYSCGVVLHQVLLGKNEFRGRDPSDTMNRVLNLVPSRVDDVRDDVSTELGDIVARALAKDPAERFASAQDFADALRRARLAPPERIAARLGELVHEDFRNPKMAEAVGATPLDALERAWLEIPDEAVSLAPEGPTVPHRSIDRTGPIDPPAFMPGGLEGNDEVTARASRGDQVKNALLVLFGSGLVLALFLALRWKPDAEPPPVLVVGAPAAGLDADDGPGSGPEGDGAAVSVAPPDQVRLPDDAAQRAPGDDPDDPQAAEEEASDARPEGSAAAGTARTGTPEARARSRGAASPARRITRTFGRHQGALEECMNIHAASIEGDPQLAIRLEVGRDGDVRRAEVVPPGVGATPLGRCLVDVSRRARFDPSDGNVTVRIPLRLRRTGS